MIDQATIDRIVDAANIVDVVSDYVTLRRSGASFKGLCPFHDDKTPSFYVNPARGICKCFSCGKGGNAVHFIMEMEQLRYYEALKFLAKKYGIEVKEKELTNEERLSQSNRESMFAVNEWASHYFHDTMTDDADARAVGLAYFRSRHFRDDIIEKFRLGYSPDSWDAMSKAAVKAGYKPEFLTRTGLSIQRDNGDLIDKYRGRVIFPWFNVSGKVVAFGGRKLDSRTKGVEQKYINSPESDVFHKSNELYGIFQAKKQIAKDDLVYMVEGYTDVISMHQCGIENVVANSGTALSIHQIKLLRRFTQNITLLYDGDEAGIHAAMRGTDMLLAEGMNIKVLLLPDQEDPDSFARKHTAADFKQYIEEHQTDFMQFKTDVMLKGVSDPIKRSEAISSIVKSISVIKDPIIRATYIKDCSQRIGIAEQTLITQMNRFIRDERNRPQTNLPETEAQNQQDNSQQQEAAQENVQRATAADIHFDRTNKEKILSETIEKLIVQSIVRYGEETIFHNVETEDGQLVNLNVIEYISLDLGADNLQLSVPLYNKILQEAVAHARDDDFKAETFFLHHPDMEISQLATTLSIDDYTLTDSMKVVHDEESLRNQVRHLILDFRMYHVEMKLRQMRQQLSAAINSTDDIMKLMQQIHELQERRNIYAKNLGNNIIT